MNSGKYLPACLIIQTGGLSTVSPRSAFKYRSFLIILYIILGAFIRLPLPLFSFLIKKEKELRSSRGALRKKQI